MGPDVARLLLPAQVLGRHSAVDVEGKLRRRSVQVSAPAGLIKKLQLAPWCMPRAVACDQGRVGFLGLGMSVSLRLCMLLQVCDLHERLKHIDMHGHHLPWAPSSNGCDKGSSDRHRARRGLQRSASHNPQNPPETGSGETLPAEPPAPKVSSTC